MLFRPRKPRLFISLCQTLFFGLVMVGLSFSGLYAQTGEPSTLYYTIQAATFPNLQQAEEAYRLLENNLPDQDRTLLRIEYLPPHFTVRVGQFGGFQAAKTALASVAKYFPDAVILSAAIKNENIKKLYGREENEEPARSGQEPPAQTQAVGQPAAGSEGKASAPPENAGTDIKRADSEGADILQSDDRTRVSLSFFNIDIRKALSALAIKLEINIVTAREVTGNISLHLHQVPPAEALEAIAMAGGCAYQRHQNLYYFYKPKAAKDPQTEELEMRLFKLKYAEVEKVQEILGSLPGTHLIQIHEPTKTVLVEDTPANIRKIETIINFWDKKPEQVMIEVKILEISLTDDMALGVNWGQMLGDVTLGTGGFSTGVMPSTAPISPVPATGSGFFGNIITGAGSNNQFTAALDALQTKTRVDTLSTPKILAIHGKPARVQVGGQLGYKVNVISEGVVTEGIEFIDTGTILEITPFIDESGDVLLNVKPSINSARIEEGTPVVNTTVVSTWLLTKTGETAFIGGLIQDTKTDTKDMIPCLGSIPAVGALFRRTTQGIGKSELIIVITPTVLGTGSRVVDEETLEKIKKMEDRAKKEPKSSTKQFLEFIDPKEEKSD